KPGPRGTGNPVQGSLVADQRRLLAGSGPAQRLAVPPLQPGLMPAFYAGFGCRRGCPADTLHTLLRQALDNRGLASADLQGIASIALKADDPGLRQLAERLDVPLVLYDVALLQPYEAQLSHRSAVAHAHSGCWGVAES